MIRTIVMMGFLTSLSCQHAPISTRGPENGPQSQQVAEPPAGGNSPNSERRAPIGLAPPTSRAATIPSGSTSPKVTSVDVLPKPERADLIWSYYSALYTFNLDGKWTVKPFAVDEWSEYSLSNTLHAFAVFNRPSLTSFLVIYPIKSGNDDQVLELQANGSEADIALWLVRHQDSSADAVANDWREFLLSFADGRKTIRAYRLTGSLTITSAHGHLKRLECPPVHPAHLAASSLRTSENVLPDPHELAAQIETLENGLNVLRKASSPAGPGSRDPQLQARQSELEHLMRVGRPEYALPACIGGRLTGHWVHDKPKRSIDLP